MFLERWITQYLYSHALAAAALVASLVMLVRLFESRRTPQSTVAWLLAIVFMPFIAIPLYLLLGQRKFPRHAKGPQRSKARIDVTPEPGEPAMAHLLRRSGVAPARSGHAFDLITTGEVAYARLLELIRRAERSIDLTIFILGDDTTGRAMLDALAERAARGVSVRLIVDAVGSTSSRRRAGRILGAAGGEVRAFMPLRHSPLRGRTNLRSHRKLGVFDGEHVFAGGMNLANEYMGPKPDELRWRDIAVIVRGPVAADATALFESDWTFCGGAARASHASATSHGDETVQIVPSGPDMTTDTVYDAFLTGIFAAHQRVAIVTPYYVPDDTLQHALLLSARRGVRTEVVVPSRSNHRIADFARRAMLRELTAAGVVVHYYPHGMVHAKAMVIDDGFAYVGSPNFDMRSLFLNYENALFAYSPAAIAQVRSFIDALIAQCRSVAPKDREHWVMEQLARLLAPEL